MLENAQSMRINEMNGQALPLSPSSEHSSSNYSGKQHPSPVHSPADNKQRWSEQGLIEEASKLRDDMSIESAHYPKHRRLESTCDNSSEQIHTARLANSSADSSSSMDSGSDSLGMRSKRRRVQIPPEHTQSKTDRAERSDGEYSDLNLGTNPISLATVPSMHPLSGSEEDEEDAATNTQPTPSASSEVDYQSVATLKDSLPYFSVLSKMIGVPSKSVKENEDHRSNEIEENEELETSFGSELTTAAYNHLTSLPSTTQSFVRRIVDDTLDRTVTFCEQPRNAITDLEGICVKAWPRMDVKRHRNRIRAYLKACRRNSKKNKGQINMKEPPMNGLSIEARQLVANALSLISEDVDQLRRTLNREHFNRKPPLSEKTDSVDRGDIVSQVRFPIPGYSNPGTDQHSPLASLKDDLSHSLSDSYQNLEHFAARKSSKCYTNPTSVPYSQDMMPNPSMPFPNTLDYSQLNFDSSYMAAMLRLLPSVLQFSGTNYSAPYTSSTLPTPYKADSMNKVSHKLPREEHTPLYPSQLLPTTLPDPYKYPTPNTAALIPPMQNAKHYTVEDYPTLDRPYVPKLHHSLQEARQSSLTDPPPAHLTSVQYSPSLNEATAKLLDVRLLTQEDTAYFLNNLEVAHEAIRYAKGVARLIIKKVELLEEQVSNPLYGTSLHPLNLS